MIADQPVFCADVVRFVGDRVAAVVAESPEQAAAAAALVAVQYQDLPVLADPAQALRPARRSSTPNTRTTCCAPSGCAAVTRRGPGRRRCRGRAHLLHVIPGTRLHGAGGGPRLHRCAGTGHRSRRGPEHARRPAPDRRGVGPAPGASADHLWPDRREPSAVARIFRCSSSWPWPPGACAGRSRSSGPARNPSSPTPNAIRST